jgi:hypothetical protein
VLGGSSSSVASDAPARGNDLAPGGSPPAATAAEIETIYQNPDSTCDDDGTYGHSHPRHQILQGAYVRLLFRLQGSDQWDRRRQGVMVEYGLVLLEATLLAFLQGLQRSFVAERVGIAKQARGVHAQMG